MAPIINLNAILPLRETSYLLHTCRSRPICLVETSPPGKSSFYLHTFRIWPIKLIFVSPLKRDIFNFHTSGSYLKAFISLWVLVPSRLFCIDFLPLTIGADMAEPAIRAITERKNRGKCIFEGEVDRSKKCLESSNDVVVCFVYLAVIRSSCITDVEINSGR